MRELSSIALVALLGGLFACGAEYMPAASGTFEPRTEWEQILVLDQTAPEARGQYFVIGTVMARARRSKNAVAACRKEAADHGGDAVTTGHIRGGEWQCTVLRRKRGASHRDAADELERD